MVGNTLTASSVESSPSNGPPTDAAVTSGEKSDMSKELDLLNGSAFWVLSFVLFLCTGGGLKPFAVAFIVLACILG